ncbi:hypothetical protein EUA79_00450 [TM7 phylum sp. oral taxon 351]|nr:hypothetical protein EUA79_00450 [TM7 phylum sp. oral taxon 351]
MNVIHSIEDNDSQIIHVSVNSNDRGATGEKGDSVVNVKITDTNRLEATLSNGQTIDGGAIPAIKTRRVFIANMDGIKRTYILPISIESSQVSYILMNGVVYSDGYVLQSGEITLNYDDLPAGRLEIVLNDNSSSSGGNISINGKTGDINLKTINGANLDGDGNIELATLDVFNSEVRDREKTDSELRDSLNNHATRISNNESAINSHSDNLSSLNANISSVNNQMTVLNNDVHEVSENYVPKTRRINDKFLSHDIRLTADDVEALPITAGATHPVRGELVVNGHVTAENATQDSHLVTKAQLDAKVAEVVNSAPETLNTLEELAKSLGDDPNFATTVANRIGTVDKKIDAEVSKLSTKVEANTEGLNSVAQKATTNSTNISLLNSAVATDKLSSDTQFSKVAKEQSGQNSLISDILNAFSKESGKGTNLKLNSSATKILGMSIYGNTEQVKTTGKNMLKITARTAPSQGISSTVSDDGTVTYSGTTTGSWANITDYTVFPTPLPAGTYTFSIDHSRTYRVVFKYKLADNTISDVIANLTATSTSNTFTVTQPIIAGYLFISAANGSILKDTIKAQLEVGDTATDYELYTGGLASPSPQLPQTINKVSGAGIYIQSKNLFNTRFGNRTLNNVEIKTYEDGSFSLNGTVSIGSSLITPTYTKSFIPAGKYKLVVEHLGGTVEKNFAGANFVASIPIQKGSVVYSSYLRPEDLNGGTKIFDVNITDVLDEKYTPFVWIPHNEATNQGFWNYKNLRLRITLVKDGEDTEFTPFDSNTTSTALPELNKIGNYQDRVYSKDGKWYLEKNTGTKTFDGSESWVKTSEDNVNIYYLTNSINSVSDYPDGFSTHFKNAKAYPNKADTFAIRGGGSSIFFNHGTITTINEWKTWLNSNNVIVVFPTLPVITEITDPTTLAQLNKLMEARTYDGLTNISVTGTDLTPEIKVKYMRKIGE